MPNALASANLARAIATTIQSVVYRKRVTVIAGIPSRETRHLTDPSQAVDFMRNGFKVQRIHAHRYPTEMIELQAFRNRPNKQFVGESMGKKIFLSQLKSTVTGRSAPTCPQPARPKIRTVFGNRAVFIDSRPESFCWCSSNILVGHRESQPFGVMVAGGPKPRGHFLLGTV
jgi:hypothetical protein